MNDFDSKIKFARMLRMMVDDASTLDLWKRCYLDQPEDRLYHAKDRTWWQRRDQKDGAPRDGMLFRADPPPEVQEMQLDLAKLRGEAKVLRAKVKRLEAKKRG